jgi:hypothetical protein
MYGRVLTVVVLLLLTLPIGAGAQIDKGSEPVDVRKIDLQGLKTGPVKGKVTAPTEIATIEQLAKEFPDEEAQTKIKAQVDFAKSKLVYFAWSGSGGDKLGFQTDKTDKGLVVTFLHKAGLTRDLHQHTALFVVPREATWKVTMNKDGK